MDRYPAVLMLLVLRAGEIGLGPQIGIYKAQDADNVRVMGEAALRLKFSQALGIEGSIYYHTHRFLQAYHCLTPEPPNDFAYWITDVQNDVVLGERLSSIDTVQFQSMTRIEEYASIAGQATIDELYLLARHLEGMTIENINSTAVGGGVSTTSATMTLPEDAIHSVFECLGINGREHIKDYLLLFISLFSSGDIAYL